jgi:D-alanyl-D-alanine carboxypeptidase/D-alanyl-D-alanine-endopeptidase (penicillin-binding protein 4)
MHALTRLIAGLSLGLALWQSATAQPQGRNMALPPAVADALARANVPPEALAAVVMPVGRTGPRWQYQADKPMQPASTMKLVTSIVALDKLGPNHRGFTELLTTAPQVGDVLQGDLVLRGGADVELSLAQLWALMAELRWAGIRELGGDIVLDRHLFRPARQDVGVPPFDEWPEFAYNSIPDALQLVDNLMGLEITSQDASQPGTVVARPVPPLPGVVIDASALRLTERACKDWDDDWISPPKVQAAEAGGLRLQLQGGFPKGCSQRAWLGLIERNALAERHLRWVWEGLGGVWRGQVREASAPLIALVRPAAPAAGVLPGANTVAPGVARAGTAGATPAGVRLLARHVARPWGELLRTMNKQSDNAFTRLLFLELGLAGMADDPAATTTELAKRAVLGWMTEHRISTQGVVLDNGSGLSRSERISPQQLALMLKAAQQGRWASELMMSLPVVGVDGTMRNRLKLSAAGGWARMKTGTLKNTTALAGYVPDAQGRLWVVASMVNHDQAAAARPALDALVDWVARGGMSSGRGQQRGEVITAP